MVLARASPRDVTFVVDDDDDEGDAEDDGTRGKCSLLFSV